MIQVGIELTEAEVADLDAVRLDRPLADYIHDAALQFARSFAGRYEAYVDSGQADADEAAAIAADLHAAEEEWG